MLPHDPFRLCRAAPPPVDAEAEREQRMALLLDFVDEVLGNPGKFSEGALFVASACSSWLDGKGSLDRDHMRLRGGKGPHSASPQNTAARIRERRRASSR